MRNPLYILVGLVLLVSSLSHAMVFDNRYLPLLQKPFITIPCTSTNIIIDGIFSTASRAYGREDEEIPLFEIEGIFNQVPLARSFLLAGLPDPFSTFPDLYRAENINYILNGKLQMQGADVYIRQNLSPRWSVGLDMAVMKVNSRINFELKERDIELVLSQVDYSQIDFIRRTMLNTLGVDCGYNVQRGFSDIDMYARYARIWNYQYKFRRIETALRMGVLFPTGKRINIYEPTSIPFGGNGHWGFYGQFEAEFEVKEDWFAGFWTRLSGRAPRTYTARMPAGKEHPRYGVVVGPARVSPSPTFVFMPYAVAQNLREGFGAGVRYNLVVHGQDSWEDARIDKTIPVNLHELRERSSWSSEYFSLNVFYDFGKVKVDRAMAPILSIVWDIPSVLLIGNHFPRTYRVTVGLQLSF
ncbi:hypothetical protein J120_01030 [candidate division TM6 bacterium JCVI TM6SC1]|uniref:Uncharacterized protein n=1 Tax=candidate division TM6 bacterium JCVI TM6SC1 TaxID=1306947 RepID=A0A0D2K5L1_9BACT|nr:hypothetical protein J120_01030 [candidate division TM6 bacterium JCVI TM6SC1]